MRRLAGREGASGDPPHCTPHHRKRVRSILEAGSPSPLQMRASEEILAGQRHSKKEVGPGRQWEAVDEREGQCVRTGLALHAPGPFMHQISFNSPKKQPCKVVLLLLFRRGGSGGQGDSVTCPRGRDPKCQELALEPDPHPAPFSECCPWGTIR